MWKEYPSLCCPRPTLYPGTKREIGKYTSDLEGTLLRIKEAAWAICKEWMDSDLVAKNHKRLWFYKTLHRNLARSRIYKKNSWGHSYTGWEEELLHEVNTNFVRPKNKSWREAILPKMLEALRTRISAMEEQCGIPQEERSFTLKKGRKRSTICGVEIEGNVSRDPKMIQSAIKRFWGDLLGTVRPFEEDVLNGLIEDHVRFPPEEHHTVNREDVLKLLKKSNKSSAGPDGIPFSLYKELADEYCDLWVDLIQSAGNPPPLSKRVLGNVSCA